MNFRFIGAMVSGFRFFKKKMANLMFICISDHDIFILFCTLLLFHMFSTLMSMELKLKVKTEVSLCMAIVQNTTIAIRIYTVLQYCVILYTSCALQT